MTAESTELPRPAEGAKRTSAAGVCFILLAACVPASMLLVLLLPDAAGVYLAQHQRALWRLYNSIAPAYVDWVEYFAVQTLAAALAICAAWHLLSHRLQRPGAFAILVGAYAIWAAASTLWSVWPYGTRAWVIRELPFWFLAVAASFLCRAERRWLTPARIFLAAALVQAAVTSIVIVHVARAQHSSLTTAFYQVPVFFQNKNYSCAFMLTGIYVTVALVVRRARGASPGLGLVVGLAAVALFGFLFVAAGALAGWVALAVSAPAFALCVLPIRRRGLIAAAAAGLVVVAALAAFSIGSLRERAKAWAMDPTATANLRVNYWTAGWHSFAARPLAGWGVGTWPCIFPRFAPPTASLMPQTATTRPEHPHNEFVRVASDLGIVGLALYVGLLCVAFVISFRALEKKPLEARLVGCALWAGALAFLVQTLFGNDTVGWSFSTNYWILLGVLASAAWWREEAPAAAPEEARGHMPAYGWPVLALVAAAVLWGWWSWGVGAYRSMRAEYVVDQAGDMLSKGVEQAAALTKLQDGVDLMRPRSLDAAKVLYYDYVVGGTMARLGQWDHAARYLEDNVERWAPGMLKSDLMLAACYANMGRADAAADRCRRYIKENPYKLDGYLRLAGTDAGEAASLLEQQLYEREGVGDQEKVLTLLQLYATLGAWDRARGLVQEAARSNHVDPAAIVRALGEVLKQNGQEAELKELGAAFPGMLPGAGQQARGTGR